MSCWGGSKTCLNNVQCNNITALSEAEDEELVELFNNPLTKPKGPVVAAAAVVVTTSAAAAAAAVVPTAVAPAAAPQLFGQANTGSQVNAGGGTKNITVTAIVSETEITSSQNHINNIQNNSVL
jgi:hypothetical protein